MVADQVTQSKFVGRHIVGVEKCVRLLRLQGQKQL
jgi:hypothetical protein